MSLCLLSSVGLSTGVFDSPSSSSPGTLLCARPQLIHGLHNPHSPRTHLPLAFPECVAGTRSEDVWLWVRVLGAPFLIKRTL